MSQLCIKMFWQIKVSEQCKHLYRKLQSRVLWYLLIMLTSSWRLYQNVSKFLLAKIRLQVVNCLFFFLFTPFYSMILTFMLLPGQLMRSWPKKSLPTVFFRDQMRKLTLESVSTAMIDKVGACYSKCGSGVSTTGLPWDLVSNWVSGSAEDPLNQNLHFCQHHQALRIHSEVWEISDVDDLKIGSSLTNIEIRDKIEEKSFWMQSWVHNKVGIQMHEGKITRRVNGDEDGSSGKAHTRLSNLKPWVLQ